MAREFGKRGARIAICAREQAELERAASDLQSRGYSVLTLVCDVTDSAQVNKMVAEVVDRWGEIDVLVNNAGIIAVGPMEAMTLQDYQDSINTHFWAALYTTLAVLPQMQRRRHGRIVNISSIGGKISVPHLLPYCAGKFALAGFSEGVRSEALKDNIYVTTVYPGLMRTGSPRNAMFKAKHRAEYAWFSIMGSSPFTSVSAERAARQIVSACQRGSARLVVGLPAKIAAKLHELVPAASLAALGLTNRFLPGQGGIGVNQAPGRESSSAVSRSWLTSLDQRAAQRNNEVIS